MLIRWTPVGRVIVAGAFAGLCLSAFAQTPKLKVRGTTQFIVGANLPWVNSAYGFDFGNNPLHPTWGIAYNSANVDSYFADMKNMNINVVRVWIMESLEGMTFDSAARQVSRAPTSWRVILQPDPETRDWAV